MLLPPITQLAADLGVAVVTVRQAYELLSKEGLIRSQRGIGTRVAALPAATATSNWRSTIRSQRRRRSPSKYSKSGAAPRCRRNCSDRATGRTASTSVSASYTPIPASRSATRRSMC
ncbi:GntR family transcriptional regulator [Cupriavidus sp. a3]|uniref:GntR family transcriptional regulator n=1 Tax=Cupriavidus sp. a3 TaxID=3242158 RepID=UPI003D9C13EF